MPYFTVFTSTYNRGYTLFRLYESLKNQGTTDFEWLIVNDGSTDNTHQLVEEWIRKEKEFSIRYLEKENGGKRPATLHRSSGTISVKSPIQRIHPLFGTSMKSTGNTILSVS